MTAIFKKQGKTIMKKALICSLLFFISFISIAQAKLDWQEKNRFESDKPVLDIASSFDGKYLFVLSPGRIQIFSDQNQLEDTIPVDSSMTSISVVGFKLGRIANKIILSSSQTGEIQVISYEEVSSIDIENAPFKGLAGAPVTLIVFGDFQ